MMVRRWLCPLILLAAASTGFGQDGEQLDRRDRREPAIVLNTGGRTGTCDVLKFTPDGKSVLAAGDDKVVTEYAVTADGREANPRLLRWPVWREQRGSIFAMDVSPDGRYVAVGGFGATNSSVAVIDRTITDAGQNRIAHIVTLERGPNENFYAVMALAFSPSGGQLAIGTGNGVVWGWDFQSPPVIVGRHRIRENGRFNRVRALRFEDENTVVSVAEYGAVARWTRAGGGWEGAKAFELPLRRDVRAATFARSGWLAAGELGPLVHLVSPDGANKLEIALKEGEFPRSLGFSADGGALAVGVGRLVQGDAFHLEGEDEIRLYGLGATGLSFKGALEHRGHAEALAWRGDRLAIAGGDNHEVTIWDTAALKRLPAARGLGSGLWGVRLTADGRYLAFNEQREASAADPNRRGSGEPRYFDLRRRRFEKSKPENVRLVEPIENYKGWTVRADEKTPWQWHVVEPQGKSHPLPWQRDEDDRPTCYTFLKPVGDGPVRLAVGHYWGFSLFELLPEGPKRVRLYTGHHGAVSSIAPAENGQWLVTASPDQTIAAWSLAEWPSKSALGANFTALPSSVRVDQIDTASPAWEMGLIPGDEIVWLAVGAQPFFGAGQAATSAEAKAALDHAQPGSELFVVVNRAGRATPFRTLTTVRRRPMWRFLPGAEREWILWMWQGSYYDCSTHGDTLAGFVMNDPTMKRSPRFYRLEQFRDVFNREDVIDELIENRDVAKALQVALGANPAPVNLGLNEPPAVRIELSSNSADKPVKARLVASARGDNVDFQPQRVEFWINDFRAQEWKPGGNGFDETLEIASVMLRSGTNKLTLQVFNRLGGRSEVTTTLNNPRKPVAAELLGLGVGINDYSSTPSVGGKRAFGNLQGPVSDITKQRDIWSSQKGKLFADASFPLLPEKKAEREKILAELERLATTAKPDDLLVVVLAGHGDFKTTPGPKPKKPVSTFYFCCPDYDPKRAAETGIDHTTLYEKLARIKCRKLVILDACHSGEAAFNPVRSLTPGGQGPTILAACDRSELAYEHPVQHNGLFTMAILKVLGDDFAKADKNSDGQLDARELIDGVRKELPALLRDAKLADDLQNPQCFPRMPDSLPLFKK
jgi:WD40 repeat protein